MKHSTKAFRTWFGGGGSGGGGGGGGGTTPTIINITVAQGQALQASSTLQPGQFYRIIDVTPDWQVIAMADSISRMSFNGEGIFNSNLRCAVLYNLTSNQLLRVDDPTYQNTIEGYANISGFPWGQAAYNNNRVTGGGVLILTGATLTSFAYNTVGEGSTFDLTNCSAQNVTRNTVIEGSAFDLSSFTGFDVTANLCDGGATQSYSGCTMLAGDIAQNQAQSGGTISLTGCTVGNNITANKVTATALIQFISSTLFNLNYNEVSASARILGDATTTNTVGINKNICASDGVLNLSGGLTGTVFNNSVTTAGIMTLAQTNTTDVWENVVSGGGTIKTSAATRVNRIRQNLVQGNDTPTNLDLTGADLSSGPYDCYENLVSNGSQLHVIDCVVNGHIRHNSLTGQGVIIFDSSSIGEIGNNTVQEEGQIYGDAATSTVEILYNQVVGESLLDLTGVTVGGNVQYNRLSSFGRVSGTGAALATFANNVIESVAQVLMAGATVSEFEDNIITSSSYINIENATITLGLTGNYLNDGSYIDLSGASIGQGVTSNEVTAQSYIEINTAVAFVGGIDLNMVKSLSYIAVAATAEVSEITKNMVLSWSYINIGPGQYGQALQNNVQNTSFINLIRCVTAGFGYNSVSELSSISMVADPGVTLTFPGFQRNTVYQSSSISYTASVNTSHNAGPDYNEIGMNSAFNNQNGTVEGFSNNQFFTTALSFSAGAGNISSFSNNTLRLVTFTGEPLQVNEFGGNNLTSTSINWIGSDFNNSDIRLNTMSVAVVDVSGTDCAGPMNSNQIFNSSTGSGLTVTNSSITDNDGISGNIIEIEGNIFIDGVTAQSVYCNRATQYGSIKLSNGTYDLIQFNNVMNSSRILDTGTATAIFNLEYNVCDGASTFEITDMSAEDVSYNVLGGNSVFDLTSAVVTANVEGNQVFASTFTTAALNCSLLSFNKIQYSNWNSAADTFGQIIHNELMAATVSTGGNSGATLDGNRILGDSQFTLSSESGTYSNNTIDNGSVVACDGNTFNRFRNNQFISASNVTIQFSVFDNVEGNIISGGSTLHGFSVITNYSFNTILNSIYTDQVVDSGDVNFNTFNTSDITLNSSIHHCEIVGTQGRVTVVIPQNYSYCSFTYGVASTFNATADFADAAQYNSVTKTWTLASPYDSFVGVWAITNSVAGTDQVDNVVNAPAHPVLVQADTTIKQFRQNGGNILISGAASTANLATTEDIISFILDRAGTGWRMTNHRTY